MVVFALIVVKGQNEVRLTYFSLLMKCYEMGIWEAWHTTSFLKHMRIDSRTLMFIILSFCPFGIMTLIITPTLNFLWSTLVYIKVPAHSTLLNASCIKGSVNPVTLGTSPVYKLICTSHHVWLKETVHMKALNTILGTLFTTNKCCWKNES